MQYTTLWPKLCVKLRCGRGVPRTAFSGEHIDDTIHKTYLGTYEELTLKALACGFCQLVIGALVRENTGLQQQAEPRDETSIYLDIVFVGSYFNRAIATDMLHKI